MTKTLRTVWLSAAVRLVGSPDTAAGSIAVELRDIEIDVGDHRIIRREALRLLDVGGPGRHGGSTGSTERPMILTPRLSNSGLILAM